MARSRGLGAGVGWLVVWILIVTVTVFAVLRLLVDVPHLLDGTLPPDDSFERRYVEAPFLFYTHIVSGLAYLILAPFQISSRIRRRSLETHRRLGSVLWPTALVSGVTAIAIGVTRPFGRFAEASATVVFGTYFLVGIVMAIRAIRARRVAEHRRWMLRVFAGGVGVGSIRIVIGISEAFGIAGFRDVFGWAFWIAFTLHVLIIELKLAFEGGDRRPRPALA